MRFLLACVEVSFRRLEARLGALPANYFVQWLADNVSAAYTATETKLFTAIPKPEPCLTPVCPAESNGVSETFVNTLKRD